MGPQLSPQGPPTPTTAPCRQLDPIPWAEPGPPHGIVSSSPCLPPPLTPLKKMKVPGRSEEGHLPPSSPPPQGLANAGGAPSLPWKVSAEGWALGLNCSPQSGGLGVGENSGFPGPSPNFPSASYDSGEDFPDSHGPSSPHRAGCGSQVAKLTCHLLQETFPKPGGQG